MCWTAGLTYTHRQCDTDTDDEKNRTKYFSMCCCTFSFHIVYLLCVAIFHHHFKSTPKAQIMKEENRKVYKRLCVHYVYISFTFFLFWFCYKLYRLLFFFGFRLKHFFSFIRYCCWCWIWISLGSFKWCNHNFVFG